MCMQLLLLHSYPTKQVQFNFAKTGKRYYLRFSNYDNTCIKYANLVYILYICVLVLKATCFCVYLYL